MAGVRGGLGVTVDLKRSFIEDEVAAFAAENALHIDDAFLYWFYTVKFDVDYDLPPGSSLAVM